MDVRPNVINTNTLIIHASTSSDSNTGDRRRSLRGVALIVPPSPRRTRPQSAVLCVGTQIACPIIHRRSVGYGTIGRMSPRARWFLAAAVVGVLALYAALAGLGLRWYTSRGPNLRDDLSTMTAAVADVVVATGDRAAVTVGGVVRARACSPEPLRAGGVYTFTVELYVTAGDEEALITGIGERLATRYRIQREAALGAAARPLTADAGRGVGLAIRQLGDGWITVVATTRCTVGPAEPADPALPQRDPAVAVVADLLAPLGTAPAETHRNTLPCPDGTTATTIAAVSRPSDADRLAQRVPVPAGATQFTAASANRVSYRTGDVSVVVAASDDNTAITVQHTTDC
jgi:hypothetical protein